MEELFIQTIEKLAATKTAQAFTHTEGQWIEESIARLKGLKTRCLKILEANKTLLERNPQLRKIREMMTDERVNEMLSKAAKNDPSLAAQLKLMGGKVKSENYSEIGAYDMSSADEKISDLDEVRQLHLDTEEIYNSLWVVRERLSGIDKFKNFNPRGVRDVRNHLMVHTKGKNSGAHIYSFGIGTRGPVLRPIKPSGVKAPTDAGFEVNLEGFLLDLRKLLV